MRRTRGVVLRTKAKGVIACLTILLFVSACADSEHMTQYYQLEQARTDALIASMESQNVELSKSRTLAMASYTTAISKASVTPSPSDDVAIALAWGYYMGAPQQVRVPNLQPVKAPPTNVEYIRAWSPIVGMAIPLLWGAVWSGNSDGGTSISASDGSNILFDSGNAGSYNYAGKDMLTELNATGSSNIGALNNTAPALEIDGGVGIEGIEDCYTDGYENPVTGKWYTDSSQSCSCSSSAEGSC